MSTHRRLFGQIPDMTISARETIAKRMRELRAEKGWSQEDLAAAADLHRTYIGAIERCERNVSIDNIEKIARALEVSVSTLLRG